MEAAVFFFFLKFNGAVFKQNLWVFASFIAASLCPVNSQTPVLFFVGFFRSPERFRSKALGGENYP